MRSLRSAPKLLFSIGSVGNSLGLSMVQYAILQCEMGADPAPLDLNFILLPYDQERAARDAENVLGMPCARPIYRKSAPVYTDASRR